MKYKQIPPLMGKSSWSVVSDDYIRRKSNLTSNEAAVMVQSLNDGIPWDRVSDCLYCQQFYEGLQVSSNIVLERYNLARDNYQKSLDAACEAAKDMRMWSTSLSKVTLL